MYSDISDKELHKIVNKHSLLTFEAQLSLRAELQKRGLNVDVSHLENTIARTQSEIKNLEYLKDFGFTAQRSAEGIVVSRTTKATFVDVLAIVAGLFVFLVGINGIINFVMTFVNGDEVDVLTLAYKAAVASLVFVAIGFFSGLKRLFDYTGFQLSNFDGVITLKKRFDVKLEEMKGKASDLFLETNDNTITLKLGNETILTSNAESLIQTMTLKELASELRGF